MPDIKISEYLTGAKKEVTVILLDGSIDAYNSELLSAKLDEVLSGKNSRIIMECSRLKFISSSGMGVFLAIEDELLDKGGGLKFVAVPDTILNVFQKVGIADIFKIYDTEAAALEDFKRGIG